MKGRLCGSARLPGDDARRKLGAAGEEVACRWLEENGWKILDRNWRTREGELDIIARDGSTTVFVEVKTRRNKSFGEPEESVTRIKMKRIRQLAAAYIYDSGLSGDVRFDVISVMPDESNRGWNVRHFESAF